MRPAKARLVCVLAFVLLAAGIEQAVSEALPPGVTGLRTEVHQYVLREVNVPVYVDGVDFQMVRSDPRFPSHLYCDATPSSGVRFPRPGTGRVFDSGPGKRGVLCQFGYLSPGQWQLIAPVRVSTGALTFRGTIQVNAWPSLTASPVGEVGADRIATLLANPDLSPEQRERLEAMSAELDQIEQEVDAAHAAAADAPH
jgi:hypothetical protein